MDPSLVVLGTRTLGAGTARCERCAMGSRSESGTTRTGRGWRWLGGFVLSAIVAVFALAVALNEAFTTERGVVVFVFAVLLGASVVSMVVCPVIGLLHGGRTIRMNDGSVSEWTALVLNLLALIVAAVLAPFALRLAFAWTVG